MGELQKGAVIRPASANDASAKALRNIVDAAQRGYLPVSDRVWGEGRWVQAYINGDGITFTMLFKLSNIAGQDRVTALLIEEEVENG